MKAAELLYAVETDVLAEIVRLLKKGSVASASWKIDRLADLGTVQARTLEIVRKYRDAVQANTVTEVQEAAYTEAIRIERDAAKARAAGLPVNSAPPVRQDPALRRTVALWESSAGKAMDLAMANLAQGAGRVYADIVARASLEVIVGADSVQAAMTRAIRDWSAEGVPVFTDSSGRDWSTEAYARMVIRTNQGRAVRDTAWYLGDAYGTDLIEVSSHAGARPKCAPYQGGVYSRSGMDPDYPSLDSTSYGEPDGLFGINCGHEPYPFWKGVSVPRGEAIDQEENARIYEESQKQRRLERGIRAAKRSVKIMEALGDAQGLAKARALVSSRQETIRNFIEETGRTRQYGREQVYDR